VPQAVVPPHPLGCGRGCGQHDEMCECSAVTNGPANTLHRLMARRLSQTNVCWKYKTPGLMHRPTWVPHTSSTSHIVFGMHPGTHAEPSGRHEEPAAHAPHCSVPPPAGRVMRGHVRTEAVVACQGWFSEYYWPPVGFAACCFTWPQGLAMARCVARLPSARPSLPGCTSPRKRRLTTVVLGAAYLPRGAHNLLHTRQHWCLAFGAPLVASGTSRAVAAQRGRSAWDEAAAWGIA
jgi:hypothetical protein